MDDIRLSDARTARVYTLLPSALGGIVSIRQVNATGPNTDTWYGCDRMGNVCLTTNASGGSNGLRWQDAHGNELASETTGQWATAANAEWYGLTTKWFDGDVELNYFWQRWEEPAFGLFVGRDRIGSSATPYGYARQRPTGYVDPLGLFEGISEPWTVPPPVSWTRA